MSLSNYKSHIINIGNLLLGGNNPIRVQSMTSTNTMDTKATVEQSVRMIDTGCEMVRITAQGVKEAEHLAVIKKELKIRGYEVPLIADIHFNPKAAEVAARIVEKVRINPGNYIDRNRGKVDYSESEYNSEIEKIRKRIKPLIDVCKEYGTVIRIGSNHGSLSERILSRFGNTPLGMVESAMEFVRICEDLDFHNIVLSMKASNVKIMVQANRLLVQRMMDSGLNYPIHLGVTEAGDAEDGRIKSAAGIGTLLEDGIGDTIRVSLTEEPEFEIPVAKMIIENAVGSQQSAVGSRHPDSYREAVGNDTKLVRMGWQSPVVIINGNNFDINKFDENFLPDYLYISGNTLSLPVLTPSGISFDYIDISFFEDQLKKKKNSVLVLESNQNQSIHEARNIISNIIKHNDRKPVILKRKYSGLSKEEFIVKAATDCSYLLVDGLIDGIWLEAENINSRFICETVFGILQATGDRITKTEFIACPSCGRTLFNIQETLQQIKSKTVNLKGIKIAIMGCIVNGPGEMTDADYGYVGAGPGKITLYRRNRPVKKNINESKAVEEMIRIIKADGKWTN
ncbi:MAG: 4-hydroxy-3-methylbut-2-en-1-yl diphosphate synthase [Bacteroidetes bacterium 4484_249]|nr:MAG: 4-hydroxy-3-methylbut-2-en-1-yl diphosphate synthase [Bacteroidetes bacterium 4484_249]